MFEALKRGVGRGRRSAAAPAGRGQAARRARGVGMALFVLLGLGGAGASAAQGFVYWANGKTGSIGRVNLDGSNPDPNFMTGVSGALAVDGAHIYWTHGGSNSTPGTGKIGRANLDG